MTEARAEQTGGNAAGSCTFVSLRFKRQAALGLVFGEVDAAVCWRTQGDSPTSQPGDRSSRRAATVVSLVRHGSEADELGVRPGMVLHSVDDHLVETGWYGGDDASDESCMDGSVGDQTTAAAVGFDDALQLIRRAGRPVTLRFIGDR